uniref:Cytochrome c oxidase subunit 3 n=1 Tax=Pauropus longiramus TaxID=933850 RepID=G9BG44_9MYRI|nr:cytochrome c oxidase subunit III [Pauropus longiramus]ADT63082.1 cytochrome c oxidase subunit III [Pauropus longiramus]
MTNQTHPFHMVSSSPWPLIASLNVMSLTTSIILMNNKLNTHLYILNLCLTFLTAILWWRDVTRESFLEGLHTLKVIRGLKLGMILFIVSEILFFTSFFWAYFHSSLSPTFFIGSLWPPIPINPFDPLQIPFLNTIILLSSGLTVTWSHHSMLISNLFLSKLSLLITILLGVYFSLLQLFEYMEASFTLADSIYSSCFFMATSFHGFHVMIGSSFLLVMLARMLATHFSKHHHFGYEAAIWYWHFVDVVWLFLYLAIYWWGL